MNIAIDGPAGAGKSTIAKKIAADLDFIYVDTGAMYRTMGLYCLRNNIDVKDEGEVSKVCKDILVSLKYIDGVQHVYLNDKDVSGLIRTQEIGATASVISAYPAVREHLLFLQRDLAAKNDVIMDGRDIGTVVLPDAELKIYLTASVEARAERRYKELIEKGESAVLSDIAAEIADRDYRDMNREIAPLKQAEDAILVDSSNMSIEEVVECIKNLKKDRA